MKFEIERTNAAYRITSYNVCYTKLLRWIATYYCCTLGDVFRAALPTGLKLESKTKVFPTGYEEMITLSEKESQMLRLIGDGMNVIADLEHKLGNDFSYSTLKSLQEKELVYAEEKIQSKYRPRTESFVKLHSSVLSEEVLTSKFELLKRAKKQEALLQHFCVATHAFEKEAKKEISKKDLSYNFV